MDYQAEIIARHKLTI